MSAPAPGDRPRVGEFTWDTVANVWWWSDDLYRLYGYEPGSVEPGLDRFLQHKDPRDMSQIDAVFTRCLQEGGPFSCYHRINDARGGHKTVVAIGFGRRDAEDTQTLEMQGYLIDVTAAGRESTEATLQVVLESRAGIEQVKGALMLVYGVDADAAFALLRGYSQVYNKKLAAIVSAVLVAFAARDDATSITRAELDRMLWDAANS
ncbi:MAG: hypothetical protein AVDCRST_MAG61-1356 [uncultured Friedmanniella sp.]|uniref:ANTAR domain-containing protein n=1 Tax=uncultured Friedmanniella sp. TaxID=335381 RepID=A0A6J4KJ11_9ACTN|nr:PAS and ANTAR domain-containing protein [uncultured Friedmanniella sp.]CAA9305954.1 MAG: hypothetical protein AVDCRST_MAG61-1356 [uncultured Friedmanniella sp.]